MAADNKRSCEKLANAFHYRKKAEVFLSREYTCDPEHSVITESLFWH